MEKRKIVYNAAREARPERWAKEILNLELSETVALNPIEKIKDDTKKTG